MAATQDRPDPRRIPDVPDPGGDAASIEALTLRIEMAELRVVRRDLEFQLHWDALQQRGKAVLVPSRWLLPALGTGASWLFWRLVRGKRHRGGRDRDGHEARGRHAFHGGHAAHGASAAASGKGAPDGQGAHGGESGVRPELGTLQLLTVLWSLMPMQIRGRVGPEITQLVLGVVAGFLQGRKKPREAPGEAPRE